MHTFPLRLVALRGLIDRQVRWYLIMQNFLQSMVFVCLISIMGIYNRQWHGQGKQWGGVGAIASQIQ